MIALRREQSWCFLRLSAELLLARAGIEDMRAMPYVRCALAESLRMYPQPPILIRRALSDDVLPAPLGGDSSGYPIGKGADIFISVWNLHRRAPLEHTARMLSACLCCSHRAGFWLVAANTWSRKILPCCAKSAWLCGTWQLWLTHQSPK